MNISYNNKILLFVLLITFFALSRVITCELTNWDDELYINFNKLIRDLSFSGIKEIFSSFVVGNYHPLTILSLAIDFHFFKLNPASYHFTNLLLHLINTALVFRFFLFLGSDGFLSSEGVVKCAGITALLFGIHPMHVESVAWISARKDVLYACFFFLSLLFYLKYKKSNDPVFYKSKNYLLSLLFFTAACLSKAMAVVLPVVLILIDYLQAKQSSPGRPAQYKGWIKKSIAVKMPFFILSLLFGIAAIKAQQSAEAFQGIETYGFFERILFAGYGLWFYLQKLLLPYNLSGFYPYPEKTKNLFPAIFYMAPLIVMFLIYFWIKYLKNYKTVVFGSLFFIANIALVIQLMPVGEAIVADRYTYIAYTGLFFIIGRGVSVFLWAEKKLSFHAIAEKLRTVVFSFLGIGFTVLFVLTWQRSGVWKNSFTLWDDVIAKQTNVWKAYNNRGMIFLSGKMYEKAISDFEAAIKAKPPYNKALAGIYNNRGVAYMNSGDLNLSMTDFNYAIQLNHNDPDLYANRADLLTRAEKYEPAMNDLNTALSINHDHALSYFFRGKLYATIGYEEKSFQDMKSLVEIDPLNYPAAYNNIAVYYIKSGQFKESLPYLNMAIKFNPGFAKAFYNRSIVYYNTGDYNQAYFDVSMARELGYNEIDDEFYKNVADKYK